MFTDSFFKSQLSSSPEDRDGNMKSIIFKAEKNLALKRINNYLSIMSLKAT